MPNSAYAKSVVSHILARRPKKWVWQGAKSWVAWTVHIFFPKGIWVSLAIQPLGMRVQNRVADRT